MKYINLFPTVVSSTMLEDISDNEIQNYIEILKKEQWGNGYDDSDFSPNGKHTINQFILDLPVFSKLKNNILNLNKEYFKNLGFIDHNFRICNSWGNLINKGESIPSHIHRNSLISGCFYLSSDNSNIYFENPIEKEWLFVMEKEKENNNNLKKPQTWTQYGISPKPNQLIFFPSWLTHVTDKSKVDGRISIAFNIIPKGFVGTPTAFINL